MIFHYFYEHLKPFTNLLAFKLAENIRYYKQYRWKTVQIHCKINVGMMFVDCVVPMHFSLAWKWKVNVVVLLWPMIWFMGVSLNIIVKVNLLTNPSKSHKFNFENTHRMHQHSYIQRHNMTSTDALHTTFTKHQPSLSVATTNKQAKSASNASNIHSNSKKKDWMKCLM